MARPRKHRHWADEEKRSICLQTRAPGVSVAQVARRYAMNANLIFKWLKDPRYVPDEAVCDVPAFLPVEISPESSLVAPLKDAVPVAPCVRHCGRVEIILPDGVRLKVEGDFDGGELACLVKGLRT
jgi:transposase